MACDSWKSKLDTYLDGELPEVEMRAFDAHVRGCPACAADTLGRVQMKRAIQSVGKRFSPSAEFRKQIQQSVAHQPRNRVRLGWIFAVAILAILVVGGLTSNYLRARSARNQIFGEIADLHVETLASASPLDVISSDRHTVKPWFQGKIPFSFNLPELQNTDFVLLGGRVTYLQQTPGAHLIYDVRKHHISVFIFPERSLPIKLGESPFSPATLNFSMETWSQAGLRFIVVGDAGMADIDGLAKLFRGS
jgi:anti-sigma factor RsiW